MPEIIYKLKIFAGIEKETVEKIILSCEEESFNKGETIMVEGEKSNGEGYIIKSGRVSVSIKGNKVAELEVGDIVGEMSLLNEEERTATVKALDDVQVIVLNLEHLIDMINNDDNSINKEIIRRMEDNLENNE